MSSKVLTEISHATKVRALYKALLKIHQGLPLHLQAVGNQYVKEEFKRHKTANEAETHVFLGEWTKYYIILAKQLSGKQPLHTLGYSLSPEMLDNFREEQLGQLMELFKETMKPKEDGPPV